MPTIEELAAEVASLRRRVEANEAVLDIHSLKARYGELVDRRFVAGRMVDTTTLRRLADEAAELFTEDGDLGRGTRVWAASPGGGPSPSG